MPSDRVDIAASPPASRSRVANGSTLWIDGVDGRSAEARRFRDAVAALVSDAFGDDPSEAQRAMARKAAALIVWSETLEAKLATGAEFDVASYTTGVNTLRRLLTDIGLERKAKDTLDLNAYMASRRAAEEKQAAEPSA